MDPITKFQQSKYFGSLDGLRAISILAVVWHHASHNTAGILSRGYLGVQLFFAISGVLITTLLLRERDSKGQINLGNFYIRRTLRIFPLYYATIAVYVVLVLLTERGTARGDAFFTHLPAYLTYTSNWFVSLSVGTSVIFYFAWSLATEEQFYLFWPSVVRLSRHWSIPAIVISLALVASEVAQWTGNHNHVLGSSLWIRIPTSIAAPICLGCLIAILLHRPKGFSFAYRIAGQAWSAPLALLLVALDFTLQFHHLLDALVMGFLVTTCIIRKDHSLRWLFENRVARHIGTISYGMYLLHMLALNATRRVFGLDASSLTLFCGTVALTVLLASASYRFFEQPFLNLKKRFSN